MDYDQLSASPIGVPQRLGKAESFFAWLAALLFYLEQVRCSAVPDQQIGTTIAYGPETVHGGSCCAKGVDNRPMVCVYLCCSSQRPPAGIEPAPGTLGSTNICAAIFFPGLVAGFEPAARRVVRIRTGLRPPAIIRDRRCHARQYPACSHHAALTFSAQPTRARPRVCSCPARPPEFAIDPRPSRPPEFCAEPSRSEES